MRISVQQATLFVILIALTTAVRAQAPATQRALRNIEIALTITIPDAFKAGAIPPGKEFEGKTLAKDLDDRVQRARGYFKAIDGADAANPTVVAIGKRIDEMDQLRVKLGATSGAQTANAAEAKAQHFAFMAELKVHEPAIAKFGEMTKDHDRDIIGSVNPATFKKWADELDLVNAACTTRYKGIQNHPTYSLNMLATSPGDWCKIAAQRETYAHRAVVNHVTAMSVRRLKDLQEVAKTPEKNDGYLMNWVVTAVSDPDGVKTALIADAKPWFAIVGKEMPDGFFGPVDRLVQDGAAEDEVEATKMQLKGSVVMAQESVSSRMYHVARQELYLGRQTPAEEQLERILAVTLEQTHAALRRFARPQRRSRCVQCERRAFASVSGCEQTDLA